MSEEIAKVNFEFFGHLAKCEACRKLFDEISKLSQRIYDHMSNPEGT